MGSWSKSEKYLRETGYRWERVRGRSLRWGLFFGRCGPRFFDLGKRARDEDNVSAINYDNTINNIKNQSIEENLPVML